MTRRTRKNSALGSTDASTTFEPLGLSSTTRNALGTNLVASLPNPFFGAHRCGANIYPEETFEAADGALAMGVNLLDWDANLLNDGALGMMHDDTVDRTTSGTGSVSSYTTMQWLNLKSDGGTYFASAWPNTMTVPLVGPVLDRYGKTSVHSIEAKTSSCVVPLIKAIQQRALQGNVVINTQIIADIATIKAAGIQAWYYFPTASISNLAAVLAAAPDKIITQVGMTTADLATVVATGIPILTGVDRQADWATYRAAGVVGNITGEPAYAANIHTPRTSDSWPSKTFGHGMLTNRANRPAFVTTPGGQAGILFDGTTNSGPFSCLIGEVSPMVAPTSLTVDLFVTMSTLPTDLSRYFQVTIADNDSTVAYGPSAANGYAVNFRADGSIYIYRADKLPSGGSTQLTSKTSAPVTAPALNERRRLRVQITATQIIATDVTTGAVATATDSTYRPGAWYLTIGKQDTTGGAWNADTLTITKS